ncbi:MAG: DUF4393 domain-containing protein [Ramlibacter sp.]|jgi:hypothetical protein|nr:DUF4393 domain-containing protein [Ramlibacter sp.]
MSDLNESVIESAKAAQEIAKTTGKAIDATREAGSFIAKFVAGPIEEGMGIFEDKLKYMRWERQVRLMQRASELLRRLGIDRPTKPVPLKVALPLLEAASLEDDDFLQDRWVALLVNAGNAASGIEIKRVYISILEQLSALEVKILDAIYALPFPESRQGGIVTTNLPESAHIETKDEQDDKRDEPQDEIKLALANLERVGCLRLGLTWGGGGSFRRINPTILGLRFVQACRT